MSKTKFTADRAGAQALDRDDELARFRRRFHVPAGNRGAVSSYLCGHSLGLMPKSAQARVDAELKRWAQHGVEGHFIDQNGWFGFHERFAKPFAALTGARSSEVVAMNSLTVNLHLMLVSFYRPTRRRHKILIEAGAFPSDRYAVESQIRYHGHDPRHALVSLAPETLSPDAFEKFFAREGGSIALIVLPGVQYLDGRRLDIEKLTAIAQRHGAAVGFDLAHAIGNTRLNLHRANVDFAVWCGYKYLNGGPGSIGGCFVHQRHGFDGDLPRFAGWWGQDKSRRFLMEDEFRRLPGAEGWQLSNPPILSMAPLAASLDLFMEAGLPALRKKSRKLTAYLEYLLRNRLGEHVQILTPGKTAERGAQLSIRVPSTHGHATELAARLRSAGVVVDAREPDVIRLAPVPLYNRFVDVFRAVDLLHQFVR